MRYKDWGKVRLLYFWKYTSFVHRIILKNLAYCRPLPSFHALLSEDKGKLKSKLTRRSHEDFEDWFIINLVQVLLRLIDPDPLSSLALSSSERFKDNTTSSAMLAWLLHLQKTPYQNIVNDKLIGIDVIFHIVSSHFVFMFEKVTFNPNLSQHLKFSQLFQICGTYLSVFNFILKNKYFTICLRYKIILTFSPNWYSQWLK